MFSIDDYVFYSTHGVCQITDIKSETFGDSGAQEYYVLKPLHTNTLAYVSMTNEALLAKIRPIMTKAEIYSLIQEMPNEEIVWLENNRERNDVFSAKLRTGDSHELVRLIKTIYFEKNQKKEAGKKISATDARIMNAAEKLLYEEFAFVLGMAPEEVLPFIQEQIELAH